MTLPISLVVTCKNRLDHLKETLPTFLDLPLENIIVVDYGCRQGTADWVQSLNSDVIVEKVDDDDFFCLARARNAALKWVNTNQILFIDADVKLKSNFGIWLAEHLEQSDTFFIAQRPCNLSLYGALICNTSDFNRAGQYDEAYRGWGGEDTDLYARFQRLGLKVSYFPNEFLEPIEHADDMRCLAVNTGGMGSKKRAILLAKIYREIKLDIEAIILCRLEDNFRHQLMTNIRKLLLKMYTHKIESESLEVTLPSLVNSPIVKKSITYRINV